MVSKTPKPMMTRKSASELKNKRPKRNISPKNMDDSVSGLSWKEERELKKALYASLQEARRSSRDEPGEDEADSPAVSKDGLSYSQSRTSLSSMGESKFLDESSVDSFVEKSVSPKPSEVKKRKIHAQRKFAAGISPSFSSEPPSKPKLKISPVKLLPVRPKTEDFLTYLCFRGTSVLPAHLDVMNVKKDDGEVNGRAGEGNGRTSFTRESSPASSSSLSHQNEDSMDVPEFTNKQQTPNRKAARASASTPETARGFANMGRKKNRSGSKLSPGSRKRLVDAYGPVGKMSGKSRSPGKHNVADRLALKRKAMATLSAARKKSPSKQNESGKKLKSSVSDGELIKRKAYGLDSPSKVKKRLNIEDRGGEVRKRKSMGDVKQKDDTPEKKMKLAKQSKQVKTLLKRRSSESKSKKLKSERFDLHPRKKLATSVQMKSKKTFKPHRPMTRAATHFKSVLKAAKMAASKKLKLKVKATPKASSSKERSALSKIVERKRKSSHTDKEKKKLSLESNISKASFGSEASGEIRIKTERFPGASDVAGIVQCPTYYPSEEQFRDPIVYIQSIQSEAEQYGMCKIVPPCSWKMESRELEDFRFTTYIQYIHKLLHKWSPITQQLKYIKRLHEDTIREKFQVPQIGGIELDLVKLYELVHKYGGMKGTVGKEKKWMKIADAMRIPKQADRVSKLYDAYCKYLLAYETLSEEETDQLMDKVQAERRKQEQTSGSPQCYKCVYKGRSQLLSGFNRASRNMQSLYGDSLDQEELESNYWEIVNQSDDHVSVQGASLDTSIYGSMFPVRRDNPYARHGWNLHNFVESKGSILHHLGLIAGVTVPTLHASMLYTSKCLSCNEHNLPTVQYLHQGDEIVWYSVPSHETDHLRAVLRKLAPNHTRDSGFCLQHGSLMVPPAKLVEKGISLSRCVQSPREFVVVFPAVNYCNVSFGYNLSESVHYGTQDWIPEGFQAAKWLGANHDSEMFSMDALLVFLARDPTTPDTTLALLLPFLERVVDREIKERRELSEAGLKESEQLKEKNPAKHSPKADVLEEIVICDVSNKICYLSMVLNSHENSAFSLDQGLSHIQKKKNLKHCKLMYRFSEDELRQLVREVKSRLRGSNTSSPASASPKRKTRKSASDGKSSPGSSNIS
ncbi:protein Jumonji-like isoform X2 [Mya arenaria]|uniref:protein Jumonji-like isoform X2 n=1 Tax=Mya arenaria TaxID=6604 RepID=UPI0022E45493|nr:protein Jumonji-like isoform X2 [Mya arenaria]